MMRIFDWPWMLAGAVVGALVMLVLVRSSFRRRLTRIARMGARPLVMRQVPSEAIRRPDARAARLAAVAGLLMLAMAGPRWGEESSIMQGEGIDIVLAMDASLSMMAPDDGPNRLERLKQEVRRLRAASRGDRFALLAFAGRSYILSPLTVDDGALDLFLDNLDPSIVGQAGSSLASPINQATDLLQASRSAGDRALVILSDGEAFEEHAAIVEAAERAGRLGIAVVTVGFGTEEGSTIPVREGNRLVEKRDDDGNIVVTRYTPLTLQAIADAADGTFIDAGETDKASRIRRALQNLQAEKRTVEAARTGTPRFQLLVIPALFLVLLDLWIAMGGRRLGARRRALSATAVGVVVAANGCAIPGASASRGGDQYLAGEYARAVSAYRDAISRGDRRPEMLYNLGTALVAADSVDAALEPLERAALRDEEELRYRATFNLGLAYLKAGRAGATGADSTRRSFAAAVVLYKRALLMRPHEVDAKWNYELALEELQQSASGGASSQQQRQQPDPEPRESESGNLGREQAEQLLNSAAREEQAVQGRKQQDARPTTRRGGKDW
jgi:Ca-activated chloride channel family protein